MKTGITTLALGLLSGIAVLCARNAPPLAEGAAPFAASPAEGVAAPVVRETRYFPGNTLVRLRGVSIQLMCYKQGTPQLHFASPDTRCGGIAVMLDGKEIRGSRRDEGEKVFYDFDGGGTLGLSVEADGRILVESAFPAASNLQIVFYLKGDCFGGTRVMIDGQSFDIPPYADKTLPVETLFDGRPKAVRLATGIPGKEFGIELSGGGKAKLINTHKGVAMFLHLIPDNPAGPFRFHLDPGGRQTTGGGAPANRTHKAAGCDTWELDRYCLPDMAHRNLLPNSSFEHGLRHMIFRHRGRQNFAIFDQKPVRVTTDEAYIGRHSLAIRSTPDGLLLQPISTQTVLFGPGDCTVSFYAKSSAPGHQKLKVQLMDPARIWDSGKWPAVEVELTGEWRRYSLTHHWKAAAAFPVVFSATSSVDATCYVDGVQLEAGKAATDYELPLADGALYTSAADNFVEYGRKVGAHLIFITAPYAKGSVAIKVRDFFDTVKYQHTFPFAADASGRNRIDLPLDNLPRGIFIVESDYEIGGGRHYEIQRFSIMSFMEGKHHHKNLFVNTYVDPLFPMQIYRDVLDRYRKLGYGARSGFANNSEQLAQLADSFGVESSICRIAHAAKDARGRRNVAILRNVEWYTIPGMDRKSSLYIEDLAGKDATADVLRQIEDAAAEIAASSPSVRGWYFLCEPEGTLPEWANPAYAKPEDFEKFTAMEAAVVRGVKRGNPAALAYTSAASNIVSPDRMKYYDRLFAAAARHGIKYDAVAAHDYTGAPEYPVSLEEQYLKLFAIMDRHGYADTKVSSPEGMHWLPLRCRKSPFVSDYPISSGHLNGLAPYGYDLSYAEKIGSAFRARAWLLGLKYQHRIRQMNASNYGTFAMDAMLTPYAFQKIPNTLSHLLGNASFLEEVKLSSDTRCYIFEDEQRRPVAVLWCCREEVDNGEAKGPDFFFKPSGALELFDLMEADHSIPADADGKARLPLSPYPVFLRGAPGGAAAMAAMLKGGTLRSNIPTPPSLQVRLESDRQVRAVLANPEATVLEGTLECNGAVHALAIPAGGKASFDHALPVPLSHGRQQDYSLRFRVSKKGQDAEVFSYDRSFAGMLARRAAAPMAIDGDPGKWSEYPRIPITRRIRGKQLQLKGIHPTEEDFSASYSVAWHEDGLYLAVFVRDDHHHVAKVPRIKDGWKNDSLQVFFDTMENGRDGHRASAIAPDDWSYGIYPQDAEGRQLAVWRYITPDVQLTRGVAGAQADTEADDVKAAFRKTADGYFYEVCFTPKSVEPFRLEKGNALGVGILLNDSDDPARQEPRSRLTNAIGTEMPNDNPASWPLVRLE